MQGESARLEAQARIFKALGQPSRLRMVRALAEGDRRVGDLQEIVGADLSTVSRHLSVLREAGIVSAEKSGTAVYYRLEMRCLANLLSCTAAFLERREALGRVP